MERTATCCFIILCLASCQKSTVNPDRSASANAKNLSSINSAVSFNNQQDIDIALLGLQVSTCTGEPLQVVSGTYHIDVHGIINKNKLSGSQHQNAQNFKLVGLGTGAVYTGTSTFNQSFEGSFIDGTYVATQTQTLLFTTPGGKNNSEVRIDVHETISANGKFSAYVDNLRFGCK